MTSNLPQATLISPAAVDHFSWQRVMLVGRFYGSSILWPFYIVLFISVGSSLVFHFLGDSSVAVNITMLFLGLSAFVLYLAPLVICRHREPVLEAMLPATAAEKTTFLVLYFLVLIPVVSCIPQLFCDHAINTVSNLPSSFRASAMMPWYVRVINIGATVLPSAICLYSTLRWPGRRGRAVLATLGSLALIFVLSSLWGGYMAFRLGYESGMAGEPLDPTNLEAFTMEIINTMMPWIGAISLLSLALIFVFIRLCCKTIASRQF